MSKPIIWSIAGSDSGGGAGLQVDLKTFEAFDVHGCTAVAAITAQNSTTVERIEPVSPSMLDAQLAALASDMPPVAIKTGLLGSADNVRVVAQWVDRLRAVRPELALVVDPVLRATTGASFADDAVLQAYRNELLPRATLITPNRHEAEALLGQRMDIEQAARALVDAGARAAVITGGDEAGAAARDFACTPQASGWLALPRIDTPHHHGTGCMFASSAAAALALGFVEAEALVLAKMGTAQALRHGYAAGRGAGPVRPVAGFASRLDNLPAWGGTAQQPFAPLVRADLGLYAIVDSADWLERALAAGVRTVQLRIKDRAHPRLSEEIRRSALAARAANAQLFINDHWALAIEHGAYGVHLGQEDLATADLDAIRAAGLRLGISTHAYWEVCRAWALRPGYIACGPIHATLLKRMPWTPQGDDNLAHWCALLQPSTPVVAIGGMDARRTQEAARCGAAGVAVVSAITGAAQPEAAIAALQAAIVLGRSLPARAAPALPRPTLVRCAE
jgi:hydroxymethylpyrimidine kinase/phosphomethylpyrimidine kinase/thiamine-phosphate diphosphorylase